MATGFFSQTVVTEFNGEEIANLTTFLTEDTNDLEPADVIYTAMILKNLARPDHINQQVYVTLYSAFCKSKFTTA